MRSGCAGAVPGPGIGLAAPATASSSSPSTTVSSSGLPSRNTDTFARAPGVMAPISGGRSLDSVTGLPLTARITSPTSTPALSAALLSWTLLTSAPRVSGSASARAFSLSIGCTATPSWPRLTLPVARSCCTAFIATSIGIAKLTPM